MYSYPLKIITTTTWIVQKTWFFNTITCKGAKLHFIMPVCVSDSKCGLFLLISQFHKSKRLLSIFILAYVYVTVVAYITIPAVSLTFDLIRSSNYSQEKSFPIELDYGVDSQQYFYYLFVHSYVTIAIIANLIASCDTTYMLYAQHAYALFAIVRWNFYFYHHFQYYRFPRFFILASCFPFFFFLFLFVPVMNWELCTF